MNDVLRSIQSVLNAPYPLSVWLIDREDWYVQLVQSCTIPSVRTGPMRGGVQVYSMSSSHIRSRFEELLTQHYWALETIRDIYPFCQPGIWVRMSDGNHRRIELEPASNRQ